MKPDRGRLWNNKGEPQTLPTLGVFLSSWRDTREQLEKKTNVITSNINTGNSTSSLPGHGGKMEIRRHFTEDEICFAP